MNILYYYQSIIGNIDCAITEISIIESGTVMTES